MALHTKILIGLLLGIAWAFLSAFFGFSTFTIDWIAPFGTIFINLLKLIAVPLIFFSIICGVAGLSDLHVLGKLGTRTLGLYVFTTLVAITIGLILVNLFKPGYSTKQDAAIDNRIAYELWLQENSQKPQDTLCYSCLPAYAERVKNIQERLKQTPADELISSKMQQAEKTKKNGPLQALIDMVPSNIILSLSDNTLMLQVIFFALFFGIAMLAIGISAAAPLLTFFQSCNLVFLKMVDLIMRSAPFFVFALLAGVVSKMAGDDITKLVELFKGLLLYAVVVITGLAIMVLVVYPLLTRLLVKDISYLKFLKGMLPAQLLAFSTSSSAATLPVTIECVEKNLHVKKEVSSFVLPIGATVNMDGTSLYQAVAVVFLAQLHLVDLSFAQQLTIVLTALLASIGSAAVPSAGLVMLIIVLESVGLNPAWIAIIFPVDRVLDMCRTVVNVTGDGAVASIMNHLAGDKLKNTR